jgi:ubiquinone/menaquinone biosynthesis C-methylase UbiE
MLQGHLDRAGQLLREQGPVGLFAGILRRLTRPLVQVGSVTFFMRGLEGDAPSQPSSEFSVRQLRASDRDALLYGSESRWERLWPRFQAGHLCFAALDEQGRAVHTRWVTLESALVPELGMDFVPGPEAAYFYDGYTRPDARHRGVDGLVRAAIFEALRALGRDRVYSYVRDDNPEGLRAARRAQQPVGTIRHVRCLGSRPWLSGAALSRLAVLLLQPIPGPPGDARRAADWRRWFEGWLAEPLARRSIGFHELPEEAFQAMAEHISSSLRLDPSRDLVLDVGCDSALVSRRVAPRCARLVGVDFIPGMLADAQRAAAPSHLCFVAADGRSLPFPPRTFAKAYCSGVIHTLPAREDGLAMILDLVRVTKPGGLVLVAAVPDVRKRGRARRRAFRLGGLREKAHIVASTALPGPLRRLLRRLVARFGPRPLHYLEYDLEEIAARLERLGLRCGIADYPAGFWSADFRETRSNLLISIPPDPREDRVS